MPKEYSQWVSEMAGTIEDASNFIKSTHNTQSLTRLQKRLYIADLLVPITDTEDDISKWMESFCVTYVTKLEPASLYNIIGQQLAKQYYNTSGFNETKLWFSAFRQKILLEKIK